MKEIDAYQIRVTVRALDQLEVDRLKLKEQEKQLEARKKAIQNSCPHLWEYIPDASGNNDSYNKCGLCGATD